MRAFTIPGAVLLVMALAVGCDQGTPTDPSVDRLAPQLEVHAGAFCPDGFVVVTVTIGDPPDGTVTLDGFACRMLTPGRHVRHLFFIDNPPVIS